MINGPPRNRFGFDGSWPQMLAVSTTSVTTRDTACLMVHLTSLGGERRRDSDRGPDPCPREGNIGKWTNYRRVRRLVKDGCRQIAQRAKPSGARGADHVCGHKGHEGHEGARRRVGTATRRHGTVV